METLRRQARLCLWLHLAGILVVAAFVGLYYLSASWDGWSLGDCRFREMLHIYCPGCGGTRCVMSFLDGRIGYSFLCYPALYVAGLNIVIYDTVILVSLIKKSEKPLRFLSYHLVTAPVWVALGFCVIRNILAYTTGFDPLGDIGAQYAPKLWLP